MRIFQKSSQVGWWMTFQGRSQSPRCCPDRAGPAGSWRGSPPSTRPRESQGHDAAVEGDVAVHVGAGVEGHDAGQMGRLHGGGEPLHPGQVRLADHPDLAGAPGLLRDPLDHVVDVVLLGLAEELELALHRLAAAAHVLVHIHISPRDEPLDVVGLPEVEHRPLRQVLEILLVAARRVRAGNSPGASGRKMSHATRMPSRMVTKTSRSTTILYCGLLSMSAGKPSGSRVDMISGLRIFVYMWSSSLRHCRAR